MWWAVRSCDGVVSLQEQKLLCNLQRLEVEGCSNLEKLPNAVGSLTSLTKLIISNCSKLVSFPATGFPPGLRDLTVRDCEGFESLPDGMMNNSCALQYLYMKGCPSLRLFPQGELPTTLKRLRIIGCESLESLPEGIIRDPSIGSSNTSDLETLRLQECSSLKSIPSGEFPSILTLLWIWKCKNLESIPGKMLQNLTSLQFLEICNCSEVVSSPEAFLSPNLKLYEEASIWVGPSHTHLSYTLHHLWSISRCDFFFRWSWVSAFSSYISRRSSNIWFPELEIRSLHGTPKPHLSGNSCIEQTALSWGLLYQRKGCHPRLQNL